MKRPHGHRNVAAWYWGRLRATAFTGAVVGGLFTALGFAIGAPFMGAIFFGIVVVPPLVRPSLGHFAVSLERGAERLLPRVSARISDLLATQRRRALVDLALTVGCLASLFAGGPAAVTLGLLAGMVAFTSHESIPDYYEREAARNGIRISAARTMLPRIEMPKKVVEQKVLAGKKLAGIRPVQRLLSARSNRGIDL